MSDPSPEALPGSVRPSAPAGVGRRLVAVTVDWLLCLAVARWLISTSPLSPLVLFAVVNVVFVGTIGTTVGMRFLGIRIVRVDRPGPVGLPAAAVRTVLLCLVIPAVVWGSDGRGLHDMAARTVPIRG